VTTLVIIFPYTTLFRSPHCPDPFAPLFQSNQFRLLLCFFVAIKVRNAQAKFVRLLCKQALPLYRNCSPFLLVRKMNWPFLRTLRSEEHTSELQSREILV